jgi:hypothetical protein
VEVIDRLFDLLRQRLLAAPTASGRDDYLAGIDDAVAASRRLCWQLVDRTHRDPTVEGVSSQQLAALFVEMEIASLIHVLEAVGDPAAADRAASATAAGLAEARTLLARARQALTLAACEW